MDQMHALMLDTARRSRPDATSVLEVGCGGGAFLSALAPYFHHAELTGIDISREAIERARRRRAPSITWQVAAVERMPFEDETFDLVVAGKTMHHWDDKQQGLFEISRVMAPRAFLILADPFTDGPLRSSWFNRLAERLDGGAFTTADDFTHMLATAHLRLVDKTFVPYSAKTLSVCTIIKD